MRLRRLLPLLALLAFAVPAHALTTISRVGSCQAASTGCTPPAHQAGDLFLVYAYESTSTPPSLGAGFTAISSNAGSGASARVACKIATSSAETIGGFTGATGIIGLIYRGEGQALTCASVSVGSMLDTINAGSGTLSYGGLTLVNQNATSWVIGCGGSNTATNVNQAPAGMATVTSVTGNGISCADTNAGTSTWTTKTVSINASTAWETFTIEIRSCQTAACLISSTAGNGTTATTVASTAANHLAGHKLIAVSIISATGSSVTGITNTAGDTWHQCSGTRQNTVFATEIWETTGATSTNASDVVTVTWGAGGTFNGVDVKEVSGVQLGACETGKTGTCASCTTVTSASFSPAVPGNFNIAHIITTTGPTVNPGTNYVFTNIGSEEYRATAPSGSQTASATFTSTTAAIIVASFKADMAGSGSQVGGFLVGF